MMNLLTLLLLTQKISNTPSVPKIPGEEYLDFSIIPSISITKVFYSDSYHAEHITTGISTVFLSVTKTGSNPL